MTYISDRGRGVRRYIPNTRTRRGLGMDLVEYLQNLGSPSPEQQCVDQANAATAPLDATIADVARNWNTNVLNSPTDVQKAVSSALALVSSASDAVGSAPDAGNQRAQALDTIYQQGQKAQVYVAAVAQANATGTTVINAPGLKQWVLDTMNAASQALVTASVLDCNMPWLASAIIAIQPYLDDLGTVVKSIANVAVAVGQTVLKVAGDLPQIWTIVKWGAIVGGAVWLLNELRQGEASGHIGPVRRRHADREDIAAPAIAKYEEFHRYNPKRVGWFPDSFQIPSVMAYAGEAKYVTYRSDKVDPSTLKRPKRPIDYIHEHDAGVGLYVIKHDPHAAYEVAVPKRFIAAEALTKLGTNLGFCFENDKGKRHEAEATRPMPDLYCTPDGNCLLVIQSRKTVLAMMWGGNLGVFARGIDG